MLKFLQEICAFHIGSLESSFMLVQVYLLCLLGVDGSIMVADGKVRPCFRWFWEAYATLEGLFLSLQIVLFCKLKQLQVH